MSFVKIRYMYGIFYFNRYNFFFQITSILNVQVRIMTLLETYMVSVERVDEYCHVDQEVCTTF